MRVLPLDACTAGIAAPLHRGRRRTRSAAGTAAHAPPRAPPHSPRMPPRPPRCGHRTDGCERGDCAHAACVCTCSRTNCVHSGWPIKRKSEHSGAINYALTTPLGRCELSHAACHAECWWDRLSVSMILVTGAGHRHFVRAPPYKTLSARKNNTPLACT